MLIDGVFAGGGVKSFAFIGALQVLEEKNYSFERVAGTSAGSIVASFIKAGYTSEEIYKLINELDAQSLMDYRKTWIPNKFMRWFLLYYKLGLYKGEQLEQWVKEKLADKGVSTFGDIQEGSLKIVVSDITRGRIVVLPDDLPQYGLIPEKFSIAKAVRMSSSIPYFFEPAKLWDRQGKKSYIVDGGVLSNFPIWLFMDPQTLRSRRPVIGFRLTPKLEDIPNRKISNALEMFHSLFETMRKAHDIRYIIKEHAQNIVFIPIDDVKATDFDLSDEMKQQLVHLGRMKTELFLKKWQY
ncbi:patatin-like phospholipase family protein [Alkalihalobacillus sp. LMS39]|uniref:patatin-like phospholipase family protein n=1 Tax=Alkalihalobacillus sp. LMS39 TaxID=2924032 RepID=UPI001FB3419E|nr:patatin-like phospholipase family protein [Alkalihalobacillus sp. LMS39]UOE95907.1 patatin-like phospholipase family protein [Alkalihalobacillus sp. LMS39]